MTLEEVNPQEITHIIWNNFYELISENVQSVTIRGQSGPNTKTVEVQKYSSSYPYQPVTSSDDYPIIVIFPPTGSFENITFRKTMDNGRITIEINATQAEAADKILDLLRYTLLYNRPNLAAVGIQSVEVDDEDNSQITRANINVHIRRIVFRFDYTFTSW